MRTDYTFLIKEDPELKYLLQQSILEKVDRLKELGQDRKNFLQYNGWEQRDEFGRYFLEAVFDKLLGGPEIVRIEKDLNALCYHLTKTDLPPSRGSKKSRWEEAYESATRETTIGDVVSRYLHVEDFRKNFKCPFHEDRSPSFKVYTKKNMFVCFGCGARGSPIDFVMKYENCSFREAVLKISNL